MRYYYAQSDSLLTYCVKSFLFLRVGRGLNYYIITRPHTPRVGVRRSCRRSCRGSSPETISSDRNRRSGRRSRRPSAHIQRPQERTGARQTAQGIQMPDRPHAGHTAHTGHTDTMILCEHIQKAGTGNTVLLSCDNMTVIGHKKTLHINTKRAIIQSQGEENAEQYEQPQGRR